MYRLTALTGVAALTLGYLVGCGTEETQKEGTAGTEMADDAEKTESMESGQAPFEPALDTEADVTLDIAGFMGNFEALDQVINDFNEYYPNVEINYEQNAVGTLKEYLENSNYVDIFMTNDANIRSKDQEGAYVWDDCLDLSAENINTEDVDPELLAAGTVDGKLARIPIARLMCGMVVNTTLLEEEGLEIPQTYEEFLAACETLKAKGYVPVQSAKFHAYSDLILPMAMCILGNDSTLTDRVNSGDTSYAESLLPVYEKLEELIGRGYLSYEVNETYPDDNYDGAILNFFEGDVPFWIATTESYSGMKKRESKSETFSANPFVYEYVNVPLGDDGVYDYEEPWYGFSVYKDSEEKEYAVEFLNFLCRAEELNKLAEVKGMPSAAQDNTDVRFLKALNPEKEAGHYVLNGVLDPSVTGIICDTANAFGRGDFADAREAVDSILYPGEEAAETEAATEE